VCRASCFAARPMDTTRFGLLRVERIECKPPRALRKSRRFSYGSLSRRAGVLFSPALRLLCTGSLYSEHTHFRIRRLLTRTGFFF